MEKPRFIKNRHLVLDFDTAESFLQCLDYSKDLLRPGMSFRGEGDETNLLYSVEIMFCDAIKKPADNVPAVFL